MTEKKETESHGQIYGSMMAICQELGSIKRGQKSPQGWMFRGIDDIMNALHPLLAKNGVIILPQMEEHKLKSIKLSNGTPAIHCRIKVTYRFVACDGSEVSTTVCNEGINNTDKATNTAMSYAFKYAIMQMFSIPTQDIAEGDSEDPEVGAKAKRKQQQKAPSKPVTSAHRKQLEALAEQFPDYRFKDSPDTPFSELLPKVIGKLSDQKATAIIDGFAAMETKLAEAKTDGDEEIPF